MEESKELFYDMKLESASAARNHVICVWNVFRNFIMGLRAKNVKIKVRIYADIKAGALRYACVWGMAEYRSGSHTVYNIKYHFVWMTKYWDKILRDLNKCLQ